MKNFFHRLLIAYCSALALWAVCYYFTGDNVALVAALTAFAPFLFLPLVFFPAYAIGLRKGWIWGALLLGLGLAWALFGRLLDVPRPAVANSAPLRVLTYNLHGGNFNAEAVSAIVRQAHPDVIAFQELNPDLANALQAGLSEYPYTQLAPEFGTAGMGTFSRYPLQSLPFTSTHMWVGVPLVAQVDAPQGKFVLMNAHLMVTHPTTTQPLEFLAQVQSTYREREGNAQEIVSWYKQQTLPTLLACDCNLTDLSTAHRQLTAGGLADSWLQAGWGFAPTFRFPHIPTPLLRVDYIWHSPEFAPGGINRLPWDGVSDHHALVAELIIPAPTNK